MLPESAYACVVCVAVCAGLLAPPRRCRAAEPPKTIRTLRGNREGLVLVLEPPERPIEFGKDELTEWRAAYLKSYRRSLRLSGAVDHLAGKVLANPTDENLGNLIEMTRFYRRSAEAESN
jgi:hypothetical protein